MKHIYRFTPYLKSAIWGGEEICRFKAIPCSRHDIGESWEVSAMPGAESVDADDGTPLSVLTRRYGERLLGRHVAQRFGKMFPLLIKFIYTHDRLSLQVHPDDALAGRRHNMLGKTEMWYIIDTKPMATILSGLVRDIDAAEYFRRVADGTLQDIVACHHSAPGDVFFLPPGRVHAAGAGNFLVEVQQASDITYRIDDYRRRDSQGKLRELHTDLAADAIDFRCHPFCKTVPQPVAPGTDQLTLCRYFRVLKESVDGTRTIANTDGSFMVLICIDGEGTATVADTTVDIAKGQSILIPAAEPSATVSGHLTLLSVTVPL